MITTSVHDDIHTFAAAVRAHLDDLPADEVDDLLDGLEADLSDQAAEAGDDFTLPDATTYAAELRAAAGLPERTDTGTVKRQPLSERLARMRGATSAQIRRNPAAAWTLDLVASFAPIWWILRAVVLYLFIAPFFWSGYGWRSGSFSYLIGATQLPGIVLMTVLLLVSVQWGRGHWAPNRILRGIRTAVTVAALVLTPFTFIALTSSLQSMLWDSSVGASAAANFTPGLSVDGQRVRNIFAFDADGNAIPTVQLFDQDGNPLTTVGRDHGSDPFDAYFYGGGGPVPVAFTAPGAADAWNIYPLREIPSEMLTWNATDDLANAKPTNFPFLRVQPVPTGVAPTPSTGTDAAPATPTPTPTTPTP